MHEVSDVRRNCFCSAQLVCRREVAKQGSELLVDAKRPDWAAQKIGEKDIHFVRRQLIEMAKGHVLAQLPLQFLGPLQRSARLLAQFTYIGRRQWAAELHR